MDTTAICQGCLSAERYLFPLDEYRNIFDMIITRNLCKNRNFKVSRLKADLFFCWECFQVLKNISKFQEKVLRAQEILEAYIKIGTDEGLQPLTSLTTKVLTKPTISINSDDTKPFQIETEKLKDSKVKIEIPIEIKVPKLGTTNIVVDANTVAIRTDGVDEKHSENDNKSDYNADIGLDTFDTGFVEDIDIELKKEPDLELLLETEFIPEDSSEIVFVQTKPVTPKRKCKKEKTHKLKAKKEEGKKRRLGKNKTIENENYLIRSDWKEKYNDLCKLVSITHEEMLQLRESIRTSEIYVNSRIQCETCIQGFTTEKDYLVHMNTKHDKHSDYKCDICKQTFKNIGTFKYHRARHFRKLQCNSCEKMYHDTYSFRRHLGKDHKKGHDCNLCGEKCQDWSSYLLHKKKAHRAGNFICDDCGARFPTKKEIEFHCRKHMTFFCRPCQSKFKHYMTYRFHKRTKHGSGAEDIQPRQKVFNPELAYCVECDIQYETESLLKKHLRNSYKHNPPVDKIFPCPECNKTYKKASTRNYHYNKAHVGITKFFCQPCEKYFLNNFQLRRHKTRVHDMVPAPKDKLCAFCGRGFSTNRTLKNHIMTHTGERPHECEYCEAKFAQKYAMKNHMKNVHRVIV